METYEIHNRELLMRGLEKCAGPDCCKETCPYYGRARGSKSCRATLLEDAVAALTKDKDDLDALEAAANTYRDERDKLREGWHDLCDERDKMAKEYEELNDYALAVEKEGQKARAEWDKLKQEITCYIQQRERAEADLHVVREQSKNLRAAMDGMRIELERLTEDNKRLRTLCQGITDRPSVCSGDLAEKCETYRAEANYWTGRAEGLLEVIKTLFGAEEAPADE